MKRMWVVDFLAIFLLAGMLLGFHSYNSKEMREIEQLRLSYTLDYCSDAAVDQMLLTDDLQMDYTEFGKVTVDPNLALDTFVNLFCINYNMSLSDENKVHVMSDFMPVFVVTAYDGYYLGTPQLTHSDTDYPENAPKNVDYNLVFGPKMPYTYAQGTNLYALNLNGKNALVFNKNSKVLMKGNLPSNLSGTGSYSKVIATINTLLTNRIGSAIDNLNVNDKGWSNSFYLPSALTTYTRVNPVTGPSVIALVQNVDITTNQPISAFSIAGSRLQARYQVACYTRKIKGIDVKYYCYMDQLKAGNTVVEIADSPEEAAMHGYAADVEYMTS